jgi:hypothetical protein
MQIVRRQENSDRKRGQSISPLFAGCLALLFVPTFAQAAGQPEPAPGFGFCWAPPPPACADKEEVYRDEAQTKACQAEVARFVNYAFVYRACLQREIQRAVLETNTTIGRFKCGMDAKHLCSDEELRKLKN